MMKQDEIRLALKEATVRVVARDGLDKTTTKSIALEAGVNEVYIYRLFAGKEDLLHATFKMLDQELADVILHHLPLMEHTEIRIEDRCRSLFYFVWEFLLDGKEKCFCFMRYYYSPYFQKLSYEEHKKIYSPVLEQFKPAFWAGTDAWLMLNFILDFMLCSATKVYQGQISKTNAAADQVYQVIYSAMEPQLVWKKKVNEAKNEE